MDPDPRSDLQIFPEQELFQGFEIICSGQLIYIKKKKLKILLMYRY